MYMYTVYTIGELDNQRVPMWKYMYRHYWHSTKSMLSVISLLNMWCWVSWVASLIVRRGMITLITRVFHVGSGSWGVRDQRIWDVWWSGMPSMKHHGHMMSHQMPWVSKKFRYLGTSLVDHGIIMGYHGAPSVILQYQLLHLYPTSFEVGLSEKQGIQKN